MIRIDTIWLAIEPLDIRTDTALVRVLKVCCAACPHNVYLFASKNGTQIKVLVADGFGLWLATRRLKWGRFVWCDGGSAPSVTLNAEQLQVLVTGLPWKKLTTDHAIAVV